MSFTQFNLDVSIQKGISTCGYTKPTPIQSQTIPEILNGHDIVACAQTGTGKTAAFVLPALQRIFKPNSSKKARVLILTPTRELATQIMKAVANYGKFLRFNKASLVGGMSYHQQLKELSRNVDLIVATPGRLLDHMKNRRLDLTGIEMLILDEADRMLDMGFIDDVTTIAKATPRRRQTLLFSATVGGKLNHVIKELLNKPIQIDLSREKIAPVQIKQELYIADNPSHKKNLLRYFLTNEKMFKTIIFSATKIGAEQLAAQLIDEGFLAASLHGDLKQSVRNKTIEKLHRNKIQYLVATDVAARGIDVSDVTHVINYDLPRFYEDYVHRIGRTGRAGKTGKAISLALQQDRRHIERIERYIGQQLERKIIEGLEPTQKTSKKKNTRYSFKKKKGKASTSDQLHPMKASKKSGKFKKPRKTNSNQNVGGKPRKQKYQFKKKQKNRKSKHS